MTRRVYSWENSSLPRLGLDTYRNLTFEEPDSERFPCLRLARQAGEKAGTCTAVLCAADEVAVELFLSGIISFKGITGVVEATLEQHDGISHPSLDDVMNADDWARSTAREIGSRGGL